jgi:uncharacterized repeat protein (TIGR01451 family)
MVLAGWGWWASVLRGAAIAAITTGALALPAVAVADRDYSVRFTRNAQGDITGTGNTLLTCRDDVAQCTAARAGQGGNANNNNNIAMRYVDVDADPATFDSSAATLSLPPGARVLFAGLYYGGRLQAGQGGTAAPAPDRRNQVLLRPPGLSGYLSLTASQIDDAPVAGAQTYRLYQGFVDVTRIVAAAGAGEYTVANVQLGTGQDPDESGGWALAIAYEDSSQPTRNLTIFDGFRFVLADGPPVDIPLSGFVTPRSGPVSTRIGLVAIEGDLGTTGDSATLNFGLPTARVLSNATNPANNFFNASISGRDGTPLHAKRPDDLNQFGYDADIFDATGLLANGQTATTLRLATSGDGFAPQGVSFATDLFAPSLRVGKSVSPVGPVRLGDTLTYTMDVANAGLDAATNAILRDAIPAGTRYVLGSLRVVSGANAGAKTDAPGDDQGDFDVAGNAVVVRLGTGAGSGPSDGGRLAVGASTSVSFQVQVDARLPVGSIVRNAATVGYVSETLGQPGDVTSPEVDTPVIVPDLAIDKSHTGEFVGGRTVPFTLAVRNVGDAPTRGLVTVTDTLPPELTFATQPQGTGWACATIGRALTCTRSDALAPGTAYPPITYDARVDRAAPAASLVNTARVANAEDGNELNDSDTDGGESRPPSVDLAIDKVALTPRVFPGDPVRFRLTVTNRGPDTATRVRVADLLPRGLTPVSATPSRGTCAVTTCRIGGLRPGDVVTIDLTAVAADDTGGRRLVDRAAVTGRETEANPRDNIDRALVVVLPLVDIVVEKTTAAPEVTAGGNASFLVLVRNDGPSTATGVVMADLLPPGLEPVSATPTQGVCPTPRTCALGRLPKGVTAQIVVVAASDAALAGQTVVNTAAARAREPERNFADNVARAPVSFVAPPPAPADVRVTKVPGATTVNVGQPFAYTITATNGGPGSAASVVVTDTPDPDLEVVSAVPSQGSCSATAPLRCDLGTLAAGASATVVVTVRAVAPGPAATGEAAPRATSRSATGCRAGSRSSRHPARSGAAACGAGASRRSGPAPPARCTSRPAPGR